jgi:hypothetical protein
MTVPAEASSVSLSDTRSLTDLVLEIIALRHQIAVLKRRGTRRPRFGLWDRLFWILLLRWWPRWPESLLIVLPETVKRWRRNGWSGLWRYRSRWRGGRPRLAREVRELIARMARENFLWSAPRIHGELLMLGYEVSQATVSRYLSTLYRRPGQSWRTFIRNQALAFSYRDDLEYAHPDSQGHTHCFCLSKATPSGGQVVRLDARSRGLCHTRGVVAAARWRARSARLSTFRRDAAPNCSSTAKGRNPVSVRMRAPPRHMEIPQSRSSRTFAGIAWTRF